jgi:hypothetical protein
MVARFFSPGVQPAFDHPKVERIADRNSIMADNPIPWQKGNPMVPQPRSRMGLHLPGGDTLKRILVLI